MIIVSESADFSGLGLGQVVTEVTPEVEALLSGFSGLDLAYKLKFQKFINDIGGIRGNIWNGIKYMFVPYFANTVDEAYLNVKTGTVKDPGQPGHKVGCSPLRGEGATYDTANYVNAANFGNVFTADTPKCIAVTISTSGLSAVADNRIGLAASSIGRLSTEVSGDIFTSAFGINIKNSGKKVYFPKTCSINGKISYLAGIANDATFNKESMTYMCNDSVADTTNLPDGTYSTEEIAFLSNTSYAFAPGVNLDYTKCKYTSMLIAEGLSKSEMIILGNALYAFNK